METGVLHERLGAKVSGVGHFWLINFKVEDTNSLNHIHHPVNIGLKKQCWKFPETVVAKNLT